MQLIDPRTQVMLPSAPQAEYSAQDSLRKHFMAVTVLAFCLVGGVGGWAATTELSSAVIAPGRVVIDGNAKDIQHLTGGVVSEILVKDGDEVASNQIVLRLDPTVARASLSIVENTLAQFYVRRARLAAEMAKRDDFKLPEEISKLSASPASMQTLMATERGLFDSRRSAIEGSRKQLRARLQQLSDEASGLSAQLKAVTEQNLLIGDEVEKSVSLYQSRIITLQRFNLLKRQKADLEGQVGQLMAAKAQSEGKTSEVNLQLLQLDQDRIADVSKDLTAAQAGVAEQEDRRAAARDQLQRLEIRSPIAGRVHQLAVNNTGAVIQPGAVLMRVVPERQDYQIEVRVSPKDIDQIHMAQNAEIRFTAFNQSVTPDIPGSIFFISPDIQSDSRTGEAYYLVKLRIGQMPPTSAGFGALYPGMPAEVFIKIGDRNVASYFTKPFTDRLSKAFREE